MLKELVDHPLSIPKIIYINIFMLKHKENQPRDNKTYQYPNQPHKTEKAITSNTHCLHTKIKMSSPPCAFSKQFQRKAN